MVVSHMYTDAMDQSIDVHTVYSCVYFNYYTYVYMHACICSYTRTLIIHIRMHVHTVYACTCTCMYCESVPPIECIAGMATECEVTCTCM